jgi:hypothetical protein
MAVPTLPPPVDIDSETKKAVIDGLKKVLGAFQKASLVDPTVTYQALISDPILLRSFIETFLAKRDLVDDVVIGRDANPVRDDNAPLACNISLNQIQQLLVRTCAKKVFEQDKPMETVTETVTRTSMFGLIKKTEQVERLAVDPIEERKVRELSRYMAYGWQLPLMDAYRSNLNYQQIMEIGEDIVALQTAANIAAVAQFDPAQLKKAKAATGADFGAILASRPQAINGISVWNRDMYEFYRKMLGDRAWTFFARDPAFFNVCASLDKSVAKIFGDTLCFISAESLVEIQRLNIDKVEVLVNALRVAFGDRLVTVLSVPAFAKEILRKVVDNLIHMNQEKDKLMTSFALTCKAMVPAVTEWLAKQRG